MKTSYRTITGRTGIILPCLLLPILFSCVKEENRNRTEFLFSIDDKEYDLAAVLFDYNRLKTASDTIDKSHSQESRIFRQNFIVNFINEELLYQEAKRRGIRVESSQIDAEIQEMKAGHTDMTFGTFLSALMLTEAMLREKIERRFAIEALILSLVKNREIPEEEMKGYFDSHREEFRHDTMCRMGQIVVKTREEAQNILAQIKKGASFEELAQQYSELP